MNDSPSRWRDHVAVVTGAAGAIGTEICTRLDALGFRIVAVDVREEGLEALTGKLTRPPLRIAADLANSDTAARIRESVNAGFGRCDVLVNNAGIVVTTAFEIAPPAALERELRVNLIAPTLLTRELLPLLQANGNGRVITVASLGGLLPIGASPVYTASKFGLRGLMLALALRTPQTGVRISIVNPSAVDTPMLRHEAMTGGSALNFLDPPQPPARIADEVIRQLEQPCIETDVPAGDGWLIRLAMLIPNLYARVMPAFARRGEKGRSRYLRERGLTPKSVEQSPPHS